MRLPQDNPAAPNRLDNSRLSRRSSQSFYGRPHQENGTAGRVGEGLFGRNSEAGSSVHNAASSSMTNNEEYNFNNILDHKCDGNRIDLLEENICKIDHCNKKFKSEKALRIHQGIVHISATRRVCGICSARFARQVDLIIHVRYRHSAYKLQNMSEHSYYSTWACTHHTQWFG